MRIPYTGTFVPDLDDKQFTLTLTYDEWNFLLKVLASLELMMERAGPELKEQVHLALWPGAREKLVPLMGKLLEVPPLAGVTP